MKIKTFRTTAYQNAYNTELSKREIQPLLEAASGLVAEITQPGYSFHSKMTFFWLEKLKLAINNYKKI